MVNSNANAALGVIFPNSYDSLVPELVGERTMASIPFAGRYRLVDFLLSSMVNCGIDNIAILVRKNYHSLMDHLGSGREWDLTRKNGGLTIFPPYSENTVKVYNGRVEALASILDFFKDQKEKYVILTDANYAVNFDFNALIDAHVKNNADVTIVYKEEEIPEGLLESRSVSADLYYTLDVKDGKVENIRINTREGGKQNLSMNLYILDRELLVKLIEDAFVHGQTYFVRDILCSNLGRLNIQAFQYDGYLARITSMKGYFEENMKMLDDANVDALFGGNPVYTKIRDDHPTRYINGAKAKNVMVADGCIIEGEVENSILFRGVKVRKGAKVKNSILMQDTVVEENADVSYVITDKNVTITADKQLTGSDTFPVYVAKHQRV